MDSVYAYDGEKPSHKAVFRVEQIHVPDVCRYGFNALDEGSSIFFHVNLCVFLALEELILLTHCEFLS